MHNPYFERGGIAIYHGDALATLKELPSESVNCCVTSPPYFALRDYGVEGQMGLEKTPEEYVAKMAALFSEVRRVLKDDGNLWLNISDSYAGSGKGGNPEDSPFDKQKSNRGTLVKNGARSENYGFKPKDLIGIPWMLAFALRADGWYLRSDIIWAKPNPMPESVTDRPTRSHEYLFLLSKSAKYYYHAAAIAEPCEGNGLTGGDHDRHSLGVNLPEAGRRKNPYVRKDKHRGHSRRHAGFNDRWDSMTKTEQCSGKRNKRDVWTISPEPYSGAHFATFPTALVRPCVLAGCPPGGTVLDPFSGAATTLLVARDANCKGIGIELNAAYIELSIKRLEQEVFDFSGAAQ